MSEKEQSNKEIDKRIFAMMEYCKSTTECVYSTWDGLGIVEYYYDLDFRQLLKQILNTDGNIEISEADFSIGERDLYLGSKILKLYNNLILCCQAIAEQKLADIELANNNLFWCMRHA